ncbi:MAG: shikimate kinase [Clostridiales bacterium]|nr:shikimate kinase [Clostridiales bacterium]
MKNIAFIGMMGSGKTVTSRIVAEKLGMNYIDIDDCLVARMGMPISVAFITLGEKTFRDYEHDVMCEVVWQDNFVISCGGGIPLHKRNMDLIENFIKVRLTASPEEIYNRTKDDFSRPLLKDNSPQKIAGMIAEREEAYSKYADITVSTDGKTIEEVADEVIRELKKLGR